MIQHHVKNAIAQHNTAYYCMIIYYFRFSGKTQARFLLVLDAVVEGNTTVSQIFLFTFVAFCHILIQTGSEEL